MLLPRNTSIIKRFFTFSSKFTKNALENLRERSLIEVKGPDASEFLQGLITNDIHHLSNGVGSMYTMFLNTKGRILYDALIYKTDQTNVYWIECDSQASNNLHKHLKMYKVRRKIDISNLDLSNIYVIYNSAAIKREKINNTRLLDGDYDETAFPTNSTNFKTFKDVFIFKDPRAAHLGYRIISFNNVKVQESLRDIVLSNNTNNYKKLRYSLGVGEGISDLLLGSSFPLECNCDYLHGVSFHKGCYIGQELTARTYHTGAIRKRLMPLFFTKEPTTLPENNIITHNKVNLGKLRGIEGELGLALLRINQSLSFENITVGDGQAKVIKPDWWPIELPKEKLNMQI